MADVIAALKAKGLMGGPQAKLASAYNQLRNKAMHAQWDQIKEPDVQSMIAFTEALITEQGI